MRFPLAVFLLTLLSVLSACGKPEPEETSQPGAIAHGLEAGQGGPLVLRIVGPAQDSRHPAVAESVRTEDEATVTQGGTTVFLNRISIKSGPKFIAFDESVLGAPVVDGHFVFELKNMVNKVRGETHRRAIRFERVTRRWFIPFSEFFPNLSEVDPGVEYLLTLDLELGDRTRKEFQVVFRSLGNGPVVETSLLASPGHSIASMNSNLLTGQMLATGEQIVNRSNRAAKVWISTDASMTLDTTLHHRFHEGREYNEPVARDHYWNGSNTVFLDRLVITSENGSPQPIPIGTPQSFVIQAGGSVTLLWFARINPDSACSWNFAPVPRSFNWNNGGGGCRRGDGECNSSFESATVHDQYSLSGIRLKGEVRRSLWVEEFSPEGLPQTADAKLLAAGAISVGIQDGQGFDQPHGPGPCASYK